MMRVVGQLGKKWFANVFCSWFPILTLKMWRVKSEVRSFIIKSIKAIYSLSPRYQILSTNNPTFYRNIIKYTVWTEVVKKCLKCNTKVGGRAIKKLSQPLFWLKDILINSTTWPDKSLSTLQHDLINPYQLYNMTW